jgi:RNA polymerase sigma factor (sigma-70 family)
MSNDVERLRRYAEEGTEEAFTELVRRHVDFVYAAALRQTRNPHRAEDVTQIVFTDLARKAAQLARRDELVGWLYTSTRYAAIKVVRREARRAQREQEAQVNEELMRDNEPQIDWDKLRPVLDEALCELSERDRAAILLRFFKGCTFAEVGTAARLTEEAARKRVERALDKLHGLLSRHGVTSTTAALATVLANEVTVAAPAGLAATVTGAALTGATVAGAGTVAALNLWTIMSTTKITLSIVGVAVFLAVGTAVYEANQARQAQAAYVAANQERDALRAQMERRDKQAREAEDKFLAAEARSTALQKSLAEAEAKRTNQRKISNVVVDQNRAALLANDEYQHLQLQQWKIRFRFRYAPLYRQLGLSPQQIAEFEDVITEGQQSFYDTNNAAVAVQVDPSDPAVRAALKSAKSSMEENLRRLLGDTGFDQYTAFNKLDPGRTYFEPVITNFYYTDTPLTAEQGDKLLEILAANAPPPQRQGTITVMPEPNWDAVIAQAQGILSAPQLANLRTWGAKGRISDQMRELEANLMRAATAAPAGSGNTTKTAP